jgi:hypothetical protein
MIRLLSLALLLLLLVPSGAEAACGVPATRAVYETPSVQVYAKKQKLIACYRATGKSIGVGESSNDGIGTDESYTVVDVLGGRWMHVMFYASAAESSDVRQDSVVDLRKDQAATANVLDDETNNEVVVLRGAVVTAGEDGVIARFTDGRREALSMAFGTALASSDSRVYWRDEVGAAHTAVLALPAADPARPLPRARTIGRCKPRPGAKLLLRDANVVLTRAGGATWACRRGKSRRLGVTSQASILDDRKVAYVRAGAVGVLDVANGKYRELQSEGGAVAASEWGLLAGTPGGLRLWGANRAAPEVIAAEPAGEVALGAADAQAFAYWMDAGGTAQSKPIS